MKKSITISLIAGISIIMLFTTIGTAQMMEIFQNTNSDQSIQERCDAVMQDPSSWDGVGYVQEFIAEYCS